MYFTASALFIYPMTISWHLLFREISEEPLQKSFGGDFCIVKTTQETFPARPMKKTLRSGFGKEEEEK